MHDLVISHFYVRQLKSCQPFTARFVLFLSVLLCKFMSVRSISPKSNLFIGIIEPVDFILWELINFLHPKSANDSCIRYFEVVWMNAESNKKTRHILFALGTVWQYFVYLLFSHVLHDSCMCRYLV